MSNERDFKGIWIPKEVIELGLHAIINWVMKEYKINLALEKPLQED